MDSGVGIIIILGIVFAMIILINAKENNDYTKEQNNINKKVSQKDLNMM
ncbi:MAG: hypothetical protein AB9856_01615 [Cellulosilyticaceae bacterium]